MTTAPHPYRHNFAAGYHNEGEARGEVKGVTKSVLAVLKARGIAVTDQERAHIVSCTDAVQLDHWLRQAVTVAVTDDLFQLKNLKTTPPYRYGSEFARRHYDAGHASGLIKGRTKSLLIILGARGFKVTDSAWDRISRCSDPDQLKTWIRRAATVTTADQLFG